MAADLKTEARQLSWSGFRRGVAMRYLAYAWLFVHLMVFPGLVSAQPATPHERARIAHILRETPLVDGHNDLAWEIRERYDGDLGRIDLNSNLSHAAPPRADLPFLMTDIPRLRAGGVGAQFWSVYVPADQQGAAAAQMVHEQIDLVRRMVARYPQTFELAQSADDIVRIHRAGRIASMFGMEGGEPINGDLSVLRDFRAEGVMYMTLTHFKTTSWADSATDAPQHGGLTEFGKQVVREMGRIGMLVDLSHVSAGVMRDALRAAIAPVIFSHSGAYAITHHPRNVPDDVLRMLPSNGGVVMVNFYPSYVSEADRLWAADDAGEEARQKALHPDDPEAAAGALHAWEEAHQRPPATVAQVADHIEHIRAIAGVDHVGLGSDFDGIPYTPVGLEGVDCFPNVLLELMRRGWSDADLSKLAGGNLLRAMRAAERVAQSHPSR
jgi:membrane dipeptidase